MAMTFPDTQRAAGTGTGFLTARSYSAQDALPVACLLYTSPGGRKAQKSRAPHWKNAGRGFFFHVFSIDLAAGWARGNR